MAEETTVVSCDAPVDVNLSINSDLVDTRDCDTDNVAKMEGEQLG